MKKFIFILIGIGLIAGIAIAATSVSNRQSAFDLNVEALSIIEEGGHGTGTCWKNIHTVENRLILICNSCIFIQGEADLFSQKGTCE